MKIYLDLDGCVCNFKKAYDSTDLPNTPKKFKQCVSHLKIFENLEWMENGKHLINFLKSFNVPIEILTSRGTMDDVLGNEAIRQKNIWLDRNELYFPRNFVKIGIMKKDYSKPGTILIDDTLRVVEAFNSGSGKAILYNDSLYSEIKPIIMNSLLNQ